MPTKLGKGGTGLQNYVPQGDLAGGQYADDATGSNNYFHSALATMLGKQDQHLPYNRSAVSQLVADQNKRNIKPLVKRELVEKIEPKKEIINDKNEIIEKIAPTWSKMEMKSESKVSKPLTRNKVMKVVNKIKKSTNKNIFSYTKKPKVNKTIKNITSSIKHPIKTAIKKISSL